MRVARCAAAFAGTFATLAAVAAPTNAATPAAPLGLRPARALLVFDRDTGRVLWARNANAELSIASLTKLMTAYVTVERSPPSTAFVEQPYDPQPSESLANVPVGDRLELEDMLRGLLLPSGNDVAHSLAIDVGSSVSGFVALMNEWAGLLHLGRTHFATPVGIDTPGNYSTADDLARLANVLMRDPLVAAVVRERSATLADGVVVDNLNRLLAHHSWIVGVKTGHTPNSGYCLVGAARLHGVNIISVVLGAPSLGASDIDSLSLLQYGLARLRRVAIARAGQTYATRPVAGRAASGRLVAHRSLVLFVKRSVRLHAARVVPRRLVGPLPAGAPVGAIEVSENGRPIATVPLVTAAAVPAPPPRPPPERASTPIRLLLAWIAVGSGLTVLLVGCSLLVMRRRVARSSVG